MRDDLHRRPWLRTLQEVIAHLPGLVSDRLELLALELHRAGRSVVQITALMLVATLLCTTAWLTLCSGLALVVVTQGVPWPLALLVVLVVNLVLAWAAVWRARHLLNHLGLPATKRHLSFGASQVTPAAAASTTPSLTQSAGGTA